MDLDQAGPELGKVIGGGGSIWVASDGSIVAPTAARDRRPNGRGACARDATRGQHVERRDQSFAQRGALDDSVDHAGREHFLTTGSSQIDLSAIASWTKTELRGRFGKDDAGVVPESSEERASGRMSQHRNKWNPIALQAAVHRGNARFLRKGQDALAVGLHTA